MAVFLLIRHGHNDMIGRGLAGRMPDIHLDSRGRQEAEELAERLARTPIRRIYSSPLERCLETAEPLARRLDLEVNILEDVNEIEFSGWAGRSFDELDGHPKWRQFNTFRSGTRIPNGELFIEVQKRMVAAMEKLRGEFPDDVVAVFSHGDPIKTALCHYAGIPLDFALRLEIGLASISALSIDDSGPRILCLNSTKNLPLSP
jgi:probable phosphoglycerate mutase